MEKFIFLATVKDRLTKLNLPQEAVNKHVKIFEDCFKGKGADEIDQVINGAGGIEDIIKSIYNLESAKNNLSPLSSEMFDKTNDDKPTDEAPILDENTIDDTKPLNVVCEKADDYTADIDKTISDDLQCAEEEITAQNSSTIEITKSPDIEEHIREAEALSDTLERTVVPTAVKTESDAEFAGELSDYDFEALFAEKLSVPEKWVESLKNKLSPQKYKTTLPLAILADVLLFIIVLALFPLLLVSAVMLSVAYIALLVGGIAFALVSIGYGVYMCFKTPEIGLYEIGIGVISLGITMLICILLYNYVKRLVPFVFMQLKKLFMLCVRITKRYFGKTEKEEI